MIEITDEILEALWELDNVVNARQQRLIEGFLPKDLHGSMDRIVEKARKLIEIVDRNPG